MKTRFAAFVGLLFLGCWYVVGADQTDFETGGKLPLSDARVAVWWTLSSAAKVRPQQAVPEHTSTAVRVRCARNEWESVQVVFRPETELRDFKLRAGSLAGSAGHSLQGNQTEVLQALYVETTTPTDKSTLAGLWPDPLIPVTKSLELTPGTNYAFWLRIHVPKDAPPGDFRGTLRAEAGTWSAEIPVNLTVYDLVLPDEMTCQTAFGFSPGEVFRYQRLRTDAQKRQVLEKYWADLSAHHISPYDPAPMDPMHVSWPEIHPPKSVWDQWQNLRLEENEAHSGKGALLVYDDKPNENVVVSYTPLIAIPPAGLHLRAWYRTAVPGHRFTLALNHYDADQKWISGHNKDYVVVGDGRWQSFDEVLKQFPAGAKYVRLNLMGTVWTDSGEKLGLVWFDDVSLQNAGTGEELIQGGDFEPKQRTELCAPAEQLHPTFDFTAWDKAMEKAFAVYHFNSVSVPIPGLGGGTFHELHQPELRGFGEDTPEYPLLLGSYCRQMEDHLRARGWLNKAYVYWFDEPSQDQFPFLQNGFRKLKQYCPDIPRMITKRVEPGLIGGPNLWCPISDEYNPERSAARQKLGERFWWYVCTGPKAPYAGLFLDHAGPEMRIWLWQTYQRHIHGVLVWQCNYWNSGTAYPNRDHPQNPYADAMSWMSGYGTPSGKKSPWGNGDGRFIYPPLNAASATDGGPVLDGPVDSIRWEQLRDGIEDYEYLTMLRQKLEERRGSLSADDSARYEKLLEVPESITRSMTEFAHDGAPIEQRRDQIARAIEQLK